jgi:hypothetical protein
MRTYLSTKCLIYFGATCNLAFISDRVIVVRLPALEPIIRLLSDPDFISKRAA